MALLRSGDVIRYDVNEQAYKLLFSVISSIGYADGGFDLQAPSSIYTLDDIVVIVNDFKRHGFIHYPEKYDRLHLWRGDYHADISCFPIALFKDQVGAAHLIYGHDWNHVQVMNLETRQVLTADKSLIEVGAEERRIEFYKTHQEHNKLAWPTPYDYFYGELKISPDQKMFLSMGWVWGSADAICAYDLNHFVRHHRIADIPVFSGEHMNRSACWVSSDVVAITYHPYQDDEEGATKEMPSEIYYYKIDSGQASLMEKVKVFEVNVLKGVLDFSPKLNALICVDNDISVAVLSLNGEILFYESDLKVQHYDVPTNRFLQIQGACVRMFVILPPAPTD